MQLNQNWFLMNQYSANMRSWKIDVKRCGGCYLLRRDVVNQYYICYMCCRNGTKYFAVGSEVSCIKYGL